MKVSEFRKLIREEVKKILKEAKLPKPGQTLEDYQLTEEGYIKPNHEEEWFELFDRMPFNSKKFTEVANKWLTQKGYKFQFDNAMSDNDGESITWKVAKA